tara:strand:- start:737 stop:1225 length:489 start_codon:yes stop_codon:yes gene_type:complete
LTNLSTDEINKKIFDIQEKWSDAIVQIGKAFLNKEDYVNLTNKFLDNLYCFKQGKVLFKPTKASNLQFRKSKNEFISYFIGHNKISAEDKGFALEPWKRIFFENFDFIILDNVLLSMGNYFFFDYQDKQLKVEYTFGYKLDINNNFKIIHHHSSLPYKNQSS